jgi:hypothetical protein
MIARPVKMLKITNFQQIIQRVDAINVESTSDETKLSRAGELIFQGSLTILHKAQECLEGELSPKISLVDEDTPVDESFCDFLNSWTQQSITTNFLAEYLIPKTKAKYQRESNSTPVYLVENDSPELKITDWEFSYEENIEQWTKQIKAVTEINQSLTLSEIVGAAHLSKAQAFLTVLMMELDLSWTGDFYESEINVSAR